MKIDIPHVTVFKAAIIIITLGFLIYGNSLFNGFFADDYHQIIDSPRVHSLKNIPSFFTGSTFYFGTSRLTGNYYKPLFATSYSLFYAAFGVNPFGYHLLQLILHITNTVLLFLLMKSWMRRTVAFFISLLFLVHPINNETVVYIANLQDALFMFFGLLALIISRRGSGILVNITAGILLFCSLLSKESGVLFLIVSPLTAFLLDKKSVWRSAFISFVVFLVYGFLRFGIAHIYFNTIVTAPIMMLPLSQRLLQIPYIIFYYLKTFFFPYDLSIFHTSVFNTVTIQNFYLPLIFDMFFFGMLVYFAIQFYRGKNALRKYYYFFFVWFIAGLLLHLQIFPLDGTVADRWFYFPIIGLLGMGGIIYEVYGKHFCEKKTVKQYFITAIVIILFFLSLRVLIRNFDWKDQFTLLSHDIASNHDSYQLEEGYGLELMKLGRYDEAYPHLLRSTEIFPGVYNLTSLGVYYANTEQYDKARTVFEKAMQYDDLNLTYENYALLLLLSRDIQQTETFTKKAVEKFPENPRLWLYLAISSYAIGHDTQALVAARESHQLQPRSASEYVLSAIQQKQRIDLSQL